MQNRIDGDRTFLASPLTAASPSRAIAQYEARCGGSIDTLV
jgi:hypothetical protein